MKLNKAVLIKGWTLNHEEYEIVDRTTKNKDVIFTGSGERLKLFLENHEK